MELALSEALIATTVVRRLLRRTVARLRVRRSRLCRRRIRSVRVSPSSYNFIRLEVVGPRMVSSQNITTPQLMC